MLPIFAKTKQTKNALTDNGSSWKCKDYLSQWECFIFKEVIIEYDVCPNIYV